MNRIRGTARCILFAHGDRVHGVVALDTCGTMTRGAATYRLSKASARTGYGVGDKPGDPSTRAVRRPASGCGADLICGDATCPGGVADSCLPPSGGLSYSGGEDIEWGGIASNTMRRIQS
jgi:hypothetical protein